MSDADLKDCPMCGCKATYIKHSAGMPGTQGYDQWDAVSCKHCRLTIGAYDRRFRSRDDAAQAWNLRWSTEDALRDEVKRLRELLNAAVDDGLAISTGGEA